jgi:FtsX-like permease family protein
MHDLSSSHSYIEATSPPAFSDQQLVEFGIARTDWNKNLGQRKREIGIRTAMGATAADILALTMKQGTVPVAIGLSMGLPAALARRPV